MNKTAGRWQQLPHPNSNVATVTLSSRMSQEEGGVFFLFSPQSWNLKSMAMSMLQNTKETTKETHKKKATKAIHKKATKEIHKKYRIKKKKHQRKSPSILLKTPRGSLPEGSKKGLPQPVWAAPGGGGVMGGGPPKGASVKV